MTKADRGIRVPRRLSTYHEQKRSHTTLSFGGEPIKEPSQEELEKEFLPYALQLGRLVYSWNRLHTHLFQIFWMITGIEDLSVASAAWHSIPSDMSQRRMLRAVTKARLPEKSKFLKDILWLLGRVDHLSDRRNDAIHAPLEFMSDTIGTTLEPDPFSENPRAKTLQEKDLLCEFKQYSAYSDALGHYAEKIYYALFWNKRLQHSERRESPDRPALPLLTDKGRGKRKSEH